MEEEKTPAHIMYVIGEAYRTQSQEEVMALYREIPDVNAVSTDGRKTYVHLAAEFADAEAMEYLIAEGARAGAKNKYGQTALHYLAIQSLNNCRRFIKDKSAIALRVKKAAEVLLKAKVSALLRDDGAGDDLCYHAAIKAGNLFLIDTLLKNRVKLDMPDKDGRNLLHLLVLYPAAKAQHAIYYAKAGVASGEEVKSESRDMIEHCFLLAKELIEYGIDPEAKDNRKTSAFEYAVNIAFEYARVKAFEHTKEYELKKLTVLLKGEYDESDSSIDDKIASGGETLHQAADLGDTVALKALIRLGANINEVNTRQYGKYQDKTPLAVACYELRENCVKALLDAGADPNFRGGEQGRSAFYYMYREMQKGPNNLSKDNSISRVIKLLFDAGFNPNGFVNDEELTPINLACHNMYSSGERLCKQLIRNELLELGVCDYNISDINGFTPLMGRAYEDGGNTENEIIMLLEGGADMTLRDNKGNTALMYAAMNSGYSNGIAAANLLFSFGNPKPETTNNEGKTALDLAVENNNENLVKFLLAKM